jgi:hypothetical protein
MHNYSLGTGFITRSVVSYEVTKSPHMFTQLSATLRRKFKKSFIGSMVFAIAIFVGFTDHNSDDPYTTNSIIKTAHAADITGGGCAGCGGGCAGCGGNSGGCGGCCGGASGM